MWVEQVIPTWRTPKDQQVVRVLYFIRCGIRRVTKVAIDKVKLRRRSTGFLKGHVSVSTFIKRYQTQRLSSIDSNSASTIFEYEASTLNHSTTYFSTIVIYPYFQ